MSAKKQLDPHRVAVSVLPKLEPLKLRFSGGRWTWKGGHSVPRNGLEAIVSRLMRETLDEMGDVERPVTSNLVREVVLAMASALVAEASYLAEWKR